ncbi:DNA-binding LacI/PurR family transcriptional regulator [Kibdelosporangium banguiense]|uniref:DNA-binding LacI/PurR family transcriptional regulator n=1 Tax=Kibdelosporangium banguiense TaxID=1365924 RepID=A0ABS4TNI3_9PSEU|nr:LacI family DNA-binding transcriptional regulator [Kibdelosporangium banguiense]MBP2325966.1 DNA-binding LacI/PurR family transcriptional regulator [Kibdelosporangium banguiense]
MVTIADVARAAGVSPSTVSYVLSGKRSISEETRRRVQRSIRKLGYHPNAGARALASSRTNVLALVIPLRTDLNVPVVMQFVAATLTKARAYDHDVLLMTKDEGPEGLRRIAASSIADALIVMDVEAAEPRLSVLGALRLPVVLIGVPDEPGEMTCVDLDFTAAGSASVTHLADLGHRDIALIGPSPAVYKRGTSYAGRFLRGFRKTAAARKIHATSCPCSPSYDALRECLDELFTSNPDVTGLVVHNEAILGPLLSELGRRGKQVPQDISVLAVCPQDMAEAHAVPLTSIAIPAAELGSLAVEMAMRQLDSETGQSEVRLLSPKLTDRGSTGPVVSQRHKADRPQ